MVILWDSARFGACRVFGASIRTGGRALADQFVHDGGTIPRRFQGDGCRACVRFTFHVINFGVGKQPTSTRVQFSLNMVKITRNCSTYFETDRYWSVGLPERGPDIELAWVTMSLLAPPGRTMF